MAQPLLEVIDLKKHFPVHGGIFSTTQGYVYAVDGISFSLNEGETIGLVGESGCGKTTAGRAILRLIEPTAGEVLFNGTPILPLGRKEMRAMRRHMQIIFQDPYASLNPRMTVGNAVGEPLAIHRIGAKKQRREMVVQLLERVGLGREHMDRYPHEFSGGQRQRIGIARALALNPKLIVADEPVSALDVSIRAQVINLLESLQQDMGLSYLFIAHDLSIVRHISRRVAVMYLGKLMEMAASGELYERPLHPYTKILLTAVPVVDPTVKRERAIISGDVPSPMTPPSGCVFHPRCPIAIPRCKEVVPPYREVAPNHFVACDLV